MRLSALAVAAPDRSGQLCAGSRCRQPQSRARVTRLWTARRTIRARRDSGETGWADCSSPARLVPISNATCAEAQPWLRPPDRAVHKELRSTRFLRGGESADRQVAAGNEAHVCSTFGARMSVMMVIIDSLPRTGYDSCDNRSALYWLSWLWYRSTPAHSTAQGTAPRDVS